MQNLHGITNSGKMRWINWAGHFQNQPERIFECLSKIVFLMSAFFAEMVLLTLKMQEFEVRNI